MTEQQLTETKLIVKFMGYVETKSENGNYYVWEHPEFGTFTEKGLSTLKYGSSWDYIMPVIESIEELGYGFFTFRKDVSITENCTISAKKIVFISGKPNQLKITSYYDAVVEFLKIYYAES